MIWTADALRPLRKHRGVLRLAPRELAVKGQTRTDCTDDAAAREFSAQSGRGDHPGAMRGAELPDVEFSEAGECV